MREATLRGQDGALARELLLQQAPLVGGALLLGFLAAGLQHGFVPGEMPWPLAGVRVSIWQIVWMGMWTGYAMALVGQAAGMFALPYSASVLQFSNPHVSPSILVLTLLNPLGAVLGFRRAGQWNTRFAGWLCAGGALGGLAGPFLRASLLADANTFRCVLGLALLIVAVQLLQKARAGLVAREAAPGAGAGRIETLGCAGAHLTIGFRGEQWTLHLGVLFAAGAAVGALSAALGLGGAFLLVPFLVIFYRLPMHVVPAATLPYAIALSAAGLFSYCVLLPLAGAAPIEPEWAWGFFAAAGGIFGAWAASKTQRYLSGPLLNAALGAICGAVGALYVIHFISSLPFGA
ncbi:MAG TPA: sulfite exporter TauE/SafE family protein [Burkholderiales bacterium]|nr:sulfite exporter TauE/SafE family protein [Burkholderiales bacterium]